MDSRTEKYYSNPPQYTNDLVNTRSSRNSKLYRQVTNQYTSTDNLPLDDNTDEIDMKKLKELVSDGSQADEKKNRTNEYNFDIIESKKRRIDQKKVYDINQLLEKAKYENNKLKSHLEPTPPKTNRSILSTLENKDLTVEEIKRECLKYETRKKQEDSLSQTEPLEMTRELKYQTKQMAIDPVSEQNLSDNDLALDLLSDLKPINHTITTKPITKEQAQHDSSIEKVFFDNNVDCSKQSSPDEDINIIKKDAIDDDFFTSSYEFSKKDFASEEYEVQQHNLLKIVLLIVAILIFLVVIIYFIRKYGMGA